jgi:threonine dehydrogenase-like Zn-dependent dehydrogenase
MRAGTIAGPARAAVTAVPVPEPGAGEVLVRIDGCGVCASNLPLWEGRPWFSYPLDPGAPGHEGWGAVEAVGETVADFVPGDRVALICDRAFAEYAVAPAEHCVRIGDAPFPGEPVGCAVNIVRRSAVEAGMRVAIVGVGFLGSLVGQLCERAGAEVIPVRRDSRVKGPFECGRLVIAGYHQDGARTVDMQSWNWRGIDVVNAHERDPLVYVDGMRAGVAGGVDVAPLLTHRFPLEQLAEAFEAARTRPKGFLKAWVAP